jgi:hypothetical protein
VISTSNPEDHCGTLSCKIVDLARGFEPHTPYRLPLCAVLRRWL